MFHKAALTFLVVGALSVNALTVKVARSPAPEPEFQELEARTLLFSRELQALGELFSREPENWDQWVKREPGNALPKLKIKVNPKPEPPPATPLSASGKIGGNPEAWSLTEPAVANRFQSIDNIAKGKREVLD